MPKLGKLWSALTETQPQEGKLLALWLREATFGKPRAAWKVEDVFGSFFAAAQEGYIMLEAHQHTAQEQVCTFLRTEKNQISTSLEKLLSLYVGVKFI